MTVRVLHSVGVARPYLRYEVRRAAINDAGIVSQLRAWDAYVCTGGHPLLRRQFYPCKKLAIIKDPLKEAKNVSVMAAFFSTDSKVPT